jgi:hypothetical protein
MGYATFFPRFCIVAFYTKFNDNMRKQPSSTNNARSGKVRNNKGGKGKANSHMGSNNNKGTALTYRHGRPSLLKTMQRLMTSFTDGVVTTDLDTCTKPMTVTLHPSAVSKTTTLAKHPLQELSCRHSPLALHSQFPPSNKFRYSASEGG